MAVPKRKKSKSKKGSRKSANMKLAAPALSVCPNCKKKKQPHRVCPYCGYYKGKLVVEKKEKSKKE